MALADFCEAHHLFAANTAFQHPARHVTTWTGFRRCDTVSSTPIYNQIDFILCRRSQRHLLQNARSYAGTLTSSDHHLVVAKLQLSGIYAGPVNTREQSSLSSRRLAVEKLPSDISMQEQYKTKVTGRLNSQCFSNLSTPTVKWQHLAEAFISAGEESIGKVERRQTPRHGWDCTMQELSIRMRDLRLKIIDCRDTEKRFQLRTERNRTSHALRRRAKECAGREDRQEYSGGRETEGRCKNV